MKAPAELPDPLRDTLIAAADAAADAADPWWVIASAAAALHGADVGEVSDVDLLMSAADARRVLARLGLPPAPGPKDPLFRSEVFGVWTAPPLPVEIMGGFCLASATGWQRILPKTRECVLIAERPLYVPSAAELARLFRLFGRPKDLSRAEALDRLSAAATPRG